MYNKNKPLASIAESQYKLAKKLQGIEEYEMPKFYKFDQLKLMQSIASSQKIIVEKYNPAPGPGPEPVDKNYFYVENFASKDLVVKIVNGKGAGAPFDSIEISDDKEKWTKLTLDIDYYWFNVPANSKVYLRAEQSSWNYWSINASEFNVGGNIMSLLYGENFENETKLENDNTFNNLFANSGVVNASELILPATTLTDHCYSNMFNGCIDLTSAPALPATTLNDYCYGSMFQGCTSLTTAPALPATTLANHCYYCMFQDCTSLTTAPELNATILANGCYHLMFYSCKSLSEVTTNANDISAVSCLEEWLSNVAQTGTFYNLGKATYETGASGIPSGWTEERSK